MKNPSQNEDEQNPAHLLEKLPEKKAPVRITFCPKCYLWGAVIDLRNRNMHIVTSNKIVDKFGNATRVIKTLEHTIVCRECGEITRRVR